MSKKHVNIYFLLTVCAILITPRLLFMFTDTDYRTFFVEEKMSGQASRNFELFGDWDSGGGRFQTSAYVPASTLMTFASFKVFGIGIWQLRLPFVISSLFCFLCFGIVLMRCCGQYTGLLFLAAMGTSPLLLSLNSTAVNENLYLSAIAFILFLFIKLEEDTDYEKDRIAAFFLGLIASLSLMIKMDGVILVPAVASVFAFGNIEKDRRRLLLTYFAFGSIAGAIMYFLYIITIPGFERTLDMYNWFDEGWNKRNYKVFKLSVFLERFYLTIPKNLQAFLPGFFFFGIMGFFTLLFSWRRQRFSVQFSLLLLLFSLTFLTSGAWTYWKRFVILIVPFFYIAANFISQLQNYDINLISVRLRFAFLISFAAALSVIAALSEFNGHWRIIAPWEYTTGAALRITAILVVPLIIAMLSVFLRQPGKLLYTAGIIVSWTLILYGAFFAANHHWRYDGDRIGNSIASILGKTTVVADTQSFKYFCYYSKSRVFTLSENDPEFPDGILELARTRKPTYIVASDAYSPIPNQIKKLLPAYKLIARYSYSQPLFFYRSRHRVQNISVFRRNE